MKCSFVFCVLVFAAYAIPRCLSAFKFKDVKFYLFTKKKPAGVLVETNYNSIINAYFNASNPIRIVIHGYLTDVNGPVIQRISKSYLSRGEFNVFGVDWSAGSGDINYFISANNTKIAGRAVLNLIQVVSNNKRDVPNNMVIIGHSLGAHVAGRAGKLIQTKWNKTVEIILGLDPAALGFNTEDPTNRLARTDATYVEVIHTCAGLYLGIKVPIGDADFWPNYGFSQPGCTYVDTCSHSRAHELFAESLKNPNPFNKIVDCPFTSSNSSATPRNSISSGDCPKPVSRNITMGGEPPNKNLSGNFYLTTNAESPFGQY